MKQKTTLKTDLVIYFKIILGSMLYAVGFQYFTYPNAIPTGGITGIAMILNYLAGFPVGITNLLINIPLFLFAWKKFGLKFMITSLVALILSSEFVDLLALAPLTATDDMLLGSIYGGILKGLGMGIIYTSGACGGGVDIVARLLRIHYPYVNFSTMLMLMDIVILGSFALLFHRYDSVMYALISMFVYTKLIDLVLYGVASTKVCYIITDESEKVREALTDHLHRGLTFLRGAGGYSGKEKNVILCVIRPREILELKTIVRGIDDKAFLIVTDSREVFGSGFTSIYDNA